ncbi:MAG TPA: hypothetical protein VFT87_02560 [Candidatus Saccharimonadales bacterium]|nr:hypothetical protein [Candidatus Saccharimonadales bacterium]
MTDNRAIHLGGKLDAAVLEAIADVICGDDTEKFPKYRSSMWLTKFYNDAGINVTHDGTTRKWWALGILEQLQPSDVEKVILRLADLREYKGDLEQLKLAVKAINSALRMDGYRVGFQNNKPVIQFADQVKLDDEIVSSPSQPDEKEFLQKQFSDDINISELGIDAVLTDYLQDRVNEAQSCPKGKVSLGTLFLLGSTLEGILLAVAIKDPAKFMAATAAPKDKAGKVYKIYDWKLSQLIDVSHELNLLNLDVKKFSHALRDFRNYIHPYHQMSQNFKPDQHTVDISWQVFKAAFFQLKAATT